MNAYARVDQQDRVALLREALRALEKTGLVQSITNLGTFVRKVGIEEVSEMYDMRAVVFGFACAQLADRATDLVAQSKSAWRH